jgi:hypothetical protein
VNEDVHFHDISYHFVAPFDATKRPLAKVCYWPTAVLGR